MTVAYSQTGWAAASPARAAATETFSDEVLIRRIANGDQLAMRTLFARHRLAIYRWEELLRHSLARLSPEHGEVIDLTYYHGKSIKEIAEIIGINEATVKSRTFYARKRLAQLVASGI